MQHFEEFANIQAATNTMMETNGAFPMERIFWIVLLLTGNLSFCQELTPDEVALRQRMLAQPPSAIVKLSERLASRQRPSTIDVPLVLNADLDGSGTFTYFIALFAIKDSTGGFLRVFQERGQDLIVAGDQDRPNEVGGYSEQLDLIDLDGDGIPEIIITSMTASGQEEFFSLFKWTGSSLHDMLGNGVETGDLVDIDNDGIQEIVDTRSDGKGFDIYKLSGSDYQFFKTLKDDPRGLTGANGTINYVRAFCKAMEPERFSLDEVHHALGEKPNQRSEEGEEQGSVHLTFGGLVRVNAGAVPTEQVDTTTVSVTPHLAPLRVSIRPARSEDRERERGRDQVKNEICEKDHGRVSVEIASADFLRALQHLHLDGPLVAGDKIELKLTARLKDGTPVGAVFTAVIVGDRGDKDKDRKNKPGD